ncbi:uncharacterized protein LOC130769815 isoform X2 [Actinidia eriantha]|uniref:uncharacterized protein LOC130769815 isoform X2 n=1 Tax=Actinidia eriantha TaxID=165200 RepID=UPI002584E34B|nr:uncharacterized protein LOC130769815 isoform X2 [Actinidia eriantha]
MMIANCCGLSVRADFFSCNFSLMLSTSSGSLWILLLIKTLERHMVLKSHGFYHEVLELFEQLWSIVRANSIDFNVWTALIEETEDVGGVFLLPNHISVRQGGSIHSYLRGLPVPSTEYFFYISSWFLVFNIIAFVCTS